MLSGISISNFSQQTEPTRFIAYANAYLQASRAMCERMGEGTPDRTWPFAAVTMLLAAHAVELFLKGAILARDPSQFKTHHKITELKQIYDGLFPEPEFSWDLPSGVEYLGFLEESDTNLLKGGYSPSILHRYPVDKPEMDDKPGIEWEGVQFFAPEMFLENITNAENDFSRIGKQLGIVT
jgi:hypothetical protein